MCPDRPHDPLHGITLKALLTDLVERRGWADLGERINIRCFTHEPSLESSLKFLRRTDWARAAVERLYLADQAQLERKRRRNQERAAQRAYAAAAGNTVAAQANAAADSEADSAPPSSELPGKDPELP